MQRQIHLEETIPKDNGEFTPLHSNRLINTNYNVSMSTFKRKFSISHLTIINNIMYLQRKKNNKSQKDPRESKLRRNKTEGSE